MTLLVAKIRPGVSMHAIARFAIDRRWMVVAAWLLLLIAVQGLSGVVGGPAYQESLSLPGTDSAQVTALLGHAGHSDLAGATGVMVIRNRFGDLRREQHGIHSVLTLACDQDDGLTGAVTPWGSMRCASATTAAASAPTSAASRPSAASLLSRDGRLAVVTLSWRTNQPAAADIQAVYAKLKRARSATLDVQFTGDAFKTLGSRQVGPPPFLLGFAAALVILAMFFRAALATITPLVCAVAALGTALGGVSLLSHAMSVSEVAPQLTELMVIGVGVDYALFIVTRHRRNLRDGMSVSNSITDAVTTSGRAVLFAGAVVCIAMLALTTLGIGYFYGLALGTAIGVALSVAASVTLLPALLSFWDTRVLTRRQRQHLPTMWSTARAVAPSTRWSRWAALVARRKWALGLAALAAVTVLAIPALALRLGHADQGNDPKGATTRAGYDLLAAPAPAGLGAGYNTSLELVVSGPEGTQTTYLDRVAAALRTTTNVNSGSVQVRPLTESISVIQFKSMSAPQDAATTLLVKHLRGQVLPPVYRGTGNHVYVYGQTATAVDFADILSAKTPLFLVVIIGLSFLLLVLAFRSLLIPLVAAAMNALAAAASYGVVVAVFQWGWGSDLLGIGRAGPIEAFAPVLFFAILFGLSTDYQVFLISAVRETWHRTHDNERAVIAGQAETGGIITAAAVIMIAVFGGFVLGDLRTIKLIGLGLATAVFIDAFLVRTVLVPAVMHVLGPTNWFYPRILRRMTPRLPMGQRPS